jgi:hypothetical protein
LIGAIAAGIAGFASINDTSATSLMTIQGTDMQETGQMIGHVTYEVRGVDGQIKHYFQSDNVITNLGKDCSAAAIFDTDDPVCATPGNFAYIAIGNATGATALATNTALAVSPGDNGGEMDRSGLIDALIDSASTNPSGTVVSIATTTPFAFDYLGSAGTKVTQSGLFDNDGTAATDNMFAIRDISSGTGGLSVTNADTLSVTWTITLT